MKLLKPWFISFALVACTARPVVDSNIIVLGVQRAGILDPLVTPPMDVYAISTDGAGKVPREPLPGLGAYPEWSPDGQWVADVERDGLTFDSSNVYIMRRDGSQRTRVTYHNGGSSHVAWSPDGTYIAYYAHDDITGTGIYLLNVECVLNEAKKCDLSPTFLTFGYSPDWSPDGKRIVYEYYEIASARHSKILVISTDGAGELVELTPEIHSCVSSSWSPDGTKIAFNCGGDIYTVKPDGTELVKLTRQNGGSNRMPIWSPDGSRIAFISSRDGLGECIGGICESGGIYSSALYSMDADGSNVIRLSHRDDESVLWYAWIP